ncbi:MAG TPA: FkbM family methyltransferase [Bryobacteraceae bacterium]|nr:FkbM family methyltransferase [Bryobacteraceae bacterium]HPU71262.1 FkbM family methyltransferase [Bryobacteraceae bacterium]
MKTLKVALAAAVVPVAALCFITPLRLSTLALLGRTKGCPFEETIRSADNLRLQIEIKDRILAASKLIGEDPAGYRLWETPKGRYWVPPGADYVLPFNLAEQERKIYGTGERAVQPGDVVLDCGANVGVYTREALAAGAKLVVAIEPAPENIECLRRNFAEEIRAGTVIVYPKGVWDKDDVLTLNVDPTNPAADSFVMHPENATPGPQAPLTTIDKLVEELKLERVDYIKMDIEGAEQRALAGARNTIARFRPRLAISAYHLPDDPEKIPEAVFRAWSGYRMECGPCADAGTFVRPDVLFFLK